MTFTLFDILILIIFSISSLLGVYRGIIYITINLLGFIASIITAIFLYSYVYILFSGYVDNDLITSIASGIASYIFSLILFTFFASKIILLFDSSSKGILDRFLGLILGIIRGGIFALILFGSIAIFTAGTYSNAKDSKDLIHNLKIEDYPEWLKESATTLYLEKALKNSTSIVPNEIWDLIKVPQASEENDDDVIEAIKKRKRKSANSSAELQDSSLNQGRKKSKKEMFIEEEE